MGLATATRPGDEVRLWEGSKESIQGRSILAIVGSEEVHPAVTVSKSLARLVRLIMPDQRVEGVAVFLNPIPLPIKWRIRFLEPVPAESPTQAPEPLWVLERTEQIRAKIQSELDQMLSERDTLW